MLCTIIAKSFFFFFCETLILMYLKHEANNCLTFFTFTIGLGTLSGHVTACCITVDTVNKASVISAVHKRKNLAFLLMDNTNFCRNLVGFPCPHWFITKSNLQLNQMKNLHGIKIYELDRKGPATPCVAPEAYLFLHATFARLQFVSYKGS